MRELLGARWALTTAVLLVGVLVAGCGEDVGSQQGPTPIPVAQACEDAFTSVATAAPSIAAPGPTAPASPVPVEARGSIGDLYPAVSACESVDEWVEAFRAHPLPSTTNADALSVLRALCQSAQQEEIQSGALCTAVLPAPGPSPSPT